MSRKSLIAMITLACASAAAHAQNSVDAPSVARAQPAAGASNAQEASSASAQSEAGAKRQASGSGEAKKDSAAQAKDDVKTLSGISILGNQDSPKSLVIVPWKTSEIGDMPGLSRLLDDSVQPIDKEVFMRELEYFEIRSQAQ